MRKDKAKSKTAAEIPVDPGELENTAWELNQGGAPQHEIVGNEIHELGSARGVRVELG